MNVKFDFQKDTICIADQQFALDTFRNFLIANYSIMVKKFIVKNIAIGIRGEQRAFHVDWEYIFALSVRTGYIIADFIMHQKRISQWNSGS